MRVFPAKAEKSTTTSARSAGPRSSECWSTLPALNTVGSVTHVVTCGGMTTGAGRKPPSVPIWTQSGPGGLRSVSGVGKTLGGSASAASTSAALSATSLPEASAT